MYVVERVARGHSYLYLVESVREGKTVRQRTIKALGRKDVLAASGELDRLAASIARHAERTIIVSDIDAGRIAARRIGGPLLFGRLWQRLGVDAVLQEVLEGRQFGFAVGTPAPDRRVQVGRHVDIVGQSQPGEQFRDAVRRQVSKRMFDKRFVESSGRCDITQPLQQVAKRGGIFYNGQP